MEDSLYIQKLAERHGLMIAGKVDFNEMGIDFRVGITKDLNGDPWLLRIPRRNGLQEQIEKEKRILSMVGQHLSVQVPDWQIVGNELIAYPLLDGKPVLTFDGDTYEVNWNMDKENPHYIRSLAKVLVDIHNTSKEEVVRNGLKVLDSDHLRTETAEHLHLVKSELGISHELEERYLRWLDNDALWPTFTKFIHGDLYAGHVLIDSTGIVTGIIDWSTAHISDTALDFSGHLTVFGEDSLKVLLLEYERIGGVVWDRIFDQVVERAAAVPLAYGFFALETQDKVHINAAKVQLGVR